MVVGVDIYLDRNHETLNLYGTQRGKGDQKPTGAVFRTAQSVRSSMLSYQEEANLPDV